MKTKVLFILIRGLKLFLGYFKYNLPSVIALSALFIVLHVAFALGGGLAKFADGAARFDIVRVYPAAGADISALAKTLSDMDEIESTTLYYPKDTKKFITDNAPTMNNVENLPDELFPAFVEAIVKDGQRNVASLEALSEKIGKLRGVNAVSYGKEWAHQLAKGKSAVMKLLAVAVILFVAAGSVMIYQVIRISLYRYIEEVRVYSVVGGTKAFIVLPFMVVAAMVAFLCAVISFIFYAVLHFAAFMQVENALGVSLSLSLTYIVLFTLLSLLVAKVSGFVSAANFLKRAYRVNED